MANTRGNLMFSKAFVVELTGTVFVESIFKTGRSQHDVLHAYESRRLKEWNLRFKYQLMAHQSIVTSPLARSNRHLKPTGRTTAPNRPGEMATPTLLRAVFRVRLWSRVEISLFTEVRHYSPKKMFLLWSRDRCLLSAEIDAVMPGIPKYQALTDAPFIDSSSRRSTSSCSCRLCCFDTTLETAKHGQQVRRKCGKYEMRTFNTIFQHLHAVIPISFCLHGGIELPFPSQR